MKKLTKITVCFALVIALMLSTTACKPTDPTPEVTPNPTPTETVAPSPNPTTPAPTKTPGGSIVFPDIWDRPQSVKKIDAGAIGGLTGGGKYEVNAVNSAKDLIIDNQNFTGKLIFKSIDVGASALTIDTPKATVEMKGAVKCGSFNVKTSENTFIVNGIAIEASDIIIDGGNIVLMEGTKVVGTIAIPATNSTTTKIEITGAKTQSITFQNTTKPIDVTVKGASDVSIDNQSTQPTTIAVEGNSKTAITNAAGSTVGVNVKGDSKTTVNNEGTSSVVIGGNSQVAVENGTTGKADVKVDATAGATSSVSFDNKNTNKNDVKVDIAAGAGANVDVGSGENAPDVTVGGNAPTVVTDFATYQALHKDTVFVGTAGAVQKIFEGGVSYQIQPSIHTIDGGIAIVDTAKPNLKIFAGVYTLKNALAINKTIKIAGVGDSTIIDARTGNCFNINGKTATTFDVSISNLKITNADHAISVGAVRFNNLKNATFSNITFENYSSKGIYLGGASGKVVVENCVFEGTALKPGGNEAQMRSGSGVDVDLYGDDNLDVNVELEIKNNTFKNFQNSGSTSGAIKLKNRGAEPEVGYGKKQAQLIATLSGNTYFHNNRDLVIGTSGILSTYPKTLNTANDKNLTEAKTYDFARFGKTKATTSAELVEMLNRTDVKYRKNITVNGDFAITADETVPYGTTLTITAGKTLTIPVGTTLTVNGAIANDGTVVNDGTIAVNDYAGLDLLYYIGGNVKLVSDFTLTEFVLVPETATLIVGAGKTLTIGSNGRIYAKGTVRNEGNIIATSQGTGSNFDNHTLHIEGATGKFYQIDGTNPEYNAVPYIAGSAYVGTDAVFKLTNSAEARITTNKTPGGNGKMNMSFKSGVVTTALKEINVRTNIIFDNSKLSHTTAGTQIVINVLDGGSFDYNGNIFTAGQTIKITDGNIPTAKIGETEYFTLEEALTAAQSGNTVDLMANTILNANATIKTGVTLKIPADKTLTFNYSKELTIEAGGILANQGKMKNVINSNTGTIIANDEAGFRAAATSGFDGYVKVNGDVTITEDLTTNNTYFTIISKGKTLTVDTGKTLSFTGKLSITLIGTIANKGRIETNGNPITIRNTGSYYNLNSNNELVPYLINKTVADSNANNNEEFVFDYEVTLYSNAIGGNRGMDCQFNSNVVMKDDTLAIPTKFSFNSDNKLTSASGKPLTITLGEKGSLTYNGTNYTFPAVKTITLNSEGVVTAPFTAKNASTGTPYSSITEAINSAKSGEVVALFINAKLSAATTLKAGVRFVINEGITLDLGWYKFTVEDTATVTNNGNVVVSVGGGVGNFIVATEKMGGAITLKTDVTLPSSQTIKSGTHLTIAPNGRLILNDGVRLTVKDGGSVTNNGLITANDVNGLKDASLIGGAINFEGYEELKVTLSEDITIKAGSSLSIYSGSGYQLIIPKGRTLTIEKGATLNVANCGLLTVRQGGKLIENGTTNVNTAGQIVRE